MKKIKQLSKMYITIGLLVAGVGAVALPAVQVAALECSTLPQSLCDSADYDGDDVSQTGIWKLLLLVVNILTAGVALTAVGGIVYGAILYVSASGSPEQVKKAKTILINVVIGILAFAFMYSLLQWLIPGGVFNV